MKQVGKIISIDNNYATLLVAKTSMCGENCGACKGGCKPSAQKVLARFDDGCEGASIGDMAILELDDRRVLSMAAMLYLLPIMAMFVAYFIGMYISKSEQISIVSALSATFLVLFSVKLFDNRLKNSKKYEIRITKVLH